MNIIKLTDDFYHLTEVFDDTMLQKIHACFQDKPRFSKLFQGDYYRLECGDFDQAVRAAILEYLQPVQQFAESILGKLYTNNSQLWEDFDGYVNAMHTDTSVNLTANIQVYVLPGVDSMGTSVIKNGDVTSVPYKYNCGYLLLRPTTTEHGMLSAVVDRRMSVYQSYRSTRNGVSEW